MKYLLDTNVLVDAAHYDYPMDSFPGFWDWIERESTNGNIKVIAAVKREISKQDDVIQDWLKERPGLVMDPDGDITDALSEVQRTIGLMGFNRERIADFNRGADPILIACALVTGDAVVTKEKSSASLKKVKIPDVCRLLEVDCLDTVRLIRRSGVKFNIGSMGNWGVLAQGEPGLSARGARAASLWAAGLYAGARACVRLRPPPSTR